MNIIAVDENHPGIFSIQQIRNMKLQRVAVENAFGLFKNKFKRFTIGSGNGEQEKNIRILKGALFIHNFIIDNDDLMLFELL